MDPLCLQDHLRSLMSHSHLKLQDYHLLVLSRVVFSFLDHDKDGFSDVAEFSAGTDPIDAGSLLQFSLPISLKNEMVMLRWDSIPGRRYRIERSNGNPHHWTVLAKGIKATKTTLEHVDLRIDNGRPVFYRLVVEVD